MPEHLLSPAEKTFRFLTADGTRMRAGDKVVQLKMSFQKTTMTDADPTKFETEGLFIRQIFKLMPFCHTLGWWKKDWELSHT